jgi:rhodanese-related sulfurtransferase
VIKQAALIVILSIGLGFGVNAVRTDGIPFVGQYRELWTGEGPIVPPGAEEGDPPFIALDVAEMEFSNGNVVFVDAREDFEFECGTIPGSINVPFDYLPPGDLVPYFDSALGGIDRDRMIITFCSGDECDLSLHLARNLQAFGYTNVAIFFGGAREWETFDLELERGPNCEEQ